MKNIGSKYTLNYVFGIIRDKLLYFKVVALKDIIKYDSHL